MSCHFSQERLALHVGGDLPARQAAVTAAHLAGCNDCACFVEGLRARQALLKSLRQETFSQAECAPMRRDVMAAINAQREGAGWVLQCERALMLCMRSRVYALAAFVLIGVVSVSVGAQRRQLAAHVVRPGAVFGHGNALVRPQGYRDWIALGAGSRSVGDGGAVRESTVYIDPAVYREYAKSGILPEGTLLVWEVNGGTHGGAKRTHRSSAALLASVKDSSRFDEGWGFFDFTADEGGFALRAEASPDANECRTCHRKDGDGPVLTPLDSLLQSAHRSMPSRMPSPEGAPDRVSRT